MKIRIHTIKQLLTEERAVSPVIGVILMVAITVILAAVIGTFVLGLGDQVQDTTPRASFSFDASSDKTNVTVTHESGEAIAAADLSIVSAEDFTQGNSTDSWETISGSSADVSAGSSLTLTATSGDFDGDEIRVVWSSPNSDASATLGKYTP